MTKPRDLANSINSGSIPGSRLANDAITASKMAPDSVASSELANDAISTSKIQNGAVTTAKLAGGPVLHVGGSASFSVAHDTATKATFGTVDFDTASGFSSNRYTPNVAGYYLVNAAVQYEGANLATQYAFIRIMKNTDIYTEGEVMALVQYASPVVSDIVYLNGTTDYIEVFMAHKQGTAQNMRGKYLSATWLRP